jgi:hypothetical protein
MAADNELLGDLKQALGVIFTRMPMEQWRKLWQAL